MGRRPRTFSAEEDLDTIWVLSFSEEANDRALARIAGLFGEVDRAVRIERAALGSADPARARPPDAVSYGRLVAAILVLEPEGIDDRGLTEIARWLLRQALEDPGFRLFVWLDGLTEGDVWRHVSVGHGLLTDLVETIQFVEGEQAGTLRGALVEHLKRVGAERPARRWRRMQLRLVLLLGWMAFLCEAGSVVAVALVGVLWFQSDWLRRVLGVLPPGVVALLLAPALFPLLSGPLRVLLGGERGFAMMAGRPQLTVILGMCILLAPIAIQGPLLRGASWSWIGMGISAGVLLDATRRARRQALRRRISPIRIVEARLHAIQAERLAREAFAAANPWRCPIVPPAGLEVFLSYAHSSAWGRRTVEQVRAALARERVSTFLDRTDIAAGSAWRGSLAEGIGEASVFLCVLDPVATRQEWVAAEVVAALAGRGVSGMPEIVVLADREPEVFPPDPQRSPVFSVLLEILRARVPGGPLFGVVPDPEDARKLPGSAVRRLAVSGSLLPAAGVALFMLVVLLGTIPGWLAVPMGAAGWIFGWLHQWGKFDSGGALVAAGALGPAYVSCGYLLGFGLRARIAARMTSTLALFDLPFDFILLGGLALLLVVWFPLARPVEVGWAATALALGFSVAAAFFSRAVPPRGLPPQTVGRSR